MKNILILGYARHGKDKVREYINTVAKTSNPSTSLRTTELVMIPWFNKNFPNLYTNILDCYSDRVNWRAAWHEVIKQYNMLDKSRLAQDILTKSNIYVGMRDIEELHASKDLFDLVIWVDRSQHQPTESVTSNSVHYDSRYMVKIDNNGSRKDLMKAVLKVCEQELL